MNGGTPQGTLLGIICFLIQMNDLKALPPIPLDELLTPPGVKQNSTSAKFVDDLSILTAIKLRENLEICENLEKPLVYHNRTEHYLPDEKNPMNEQINNLLEFTEINEMKINKYKTKVMLFNRATSLDFQSNILLESSPLDVVEETKILGIMLSSDLKWKKHVDFVRKKCLKKMWSIRRMKEIGGSIHDMIDVFTLQIRCLAEIGCPSWNGALTQKDITKLESIQKIALRIMLGEHLQRLSKCSQYIKTFQAG